MSSSILLKRSNTAGNNSYVGGLGELTIDTQARKIRLHDGITMGGHVVANMTDINSIVERIDGLQISDISGLSQALSAISDKADKTTLITAGQGLTGGGDISTNRTISLGTPGTINATSTNITTADSHTHELVITKSDIGLSNVDNTSDLNKPISIAAQSALDNKVSKADLGTANGVATLDASGKVLTTQLPSFVDDVLEYTDLESFPVTGESGKIYVDITTNKTYRWSGSTYINIPAGSVDSVNGKTGVVTLTKSDVGLGNVDNTSDINKPISAAVQSALNNKSNIDSPVFTGTPKAPTPAIGDNSTNIATTAFVQAELSQFNPSAVSSIIGTSPININDDDPETPIISISDVTTITSGAMSATDKVKLDGIQTGAQVNTVTSVASKTGDIVLVKSDVGLGNVDNFSTASNEVAILATATDRFVTPAGIKAFVEQGTYVIDGGTF